MLSSSRLHLPSQSPCSGLTRWSFEWEVAACQHLFVSKAFEPFALHPCPLHRWALLSSLLVVPSVCWHLSDQHEESSVDVDGAPWPPHWTNTVRLKAFSSSSCWRHSYLRACREYDLISLRWERRLLDDVFDFSISSKRSFQIVIIGYPTLGASLGVLLISSTIWDTWSGSKEW